MKTRNATRWSGALLIAATVMPGAAAAQAEQLVLRDIGPRTEVPVAADRLHQQAEQLMEQKVQDVWPKAARLYIRSARLRTADDPGREDCLIKAANLLQHSQPDESIGLVIEAADHALARGDIVRAAHRYLDAVTIVQELRFRNEAQVQLAREAAGKAKLLAGSPVLSEAERATLMSRWR